MPRREDRRQPDLSNDRALPALQKQLERLADLKGRSYRDAESDEDQWEHLTQSIIERTFGNPSTNLNKFHNARWAGTHTIGGDDAESETNYALRLKAYEALLLSLIEEIHLFLPKDEIKSHSTSVNTGEFLFGDSTVKVAASAEHDVEVTARKKVFIVHGHDEGMKQYVARVVERLGLIPVILAEQAGRNRTLMEKLLDHSDVGFAVVLLSPDDNLTYVEGKAKGTTVTRSRQNVVLELGLFIGKLGRSRVVTLYRPDDAFERPSDYDGVEYVPYDTGGSWRLRLCTELKAAGYDVDANRL